MVFNGRTDLASEAHRLWRQSAGKTSALPGVRAEESRHGPLSVTAVEILDERGQQALGKPPGLYYTLELPSSFSRDRELFSQAARLLSELLGRCFPFRETTRVLIAALGNPDITPDAVGPLAASHLLVTRHLKQKEAALFGRFRETAVCRPGVLGTSGVESALQLRALCALLRPVCVLAVDALAGTELEGLCRRVQLCDSGIAPGSGVGNDRQALNEESLGVPVIALGVPTVIDASSLCSEEGVSRLFVTPRDIDRRVRDIARLVGYGVDLALQEGMTVADVDMFLS
jgi:spore protease